LATSRHKQKAPKTYVFRAIISLSIRRGAITNAHSAYPFFHPDYTVGPGFAPDLLATKASSRALPALLTGITADRELARRNAPHPALKVYVNEINYTTAG